MFNERKLQFSIVIFFIFASDSWESIQFCFVSQVRMPSNAFPDLHGAQHLQLENLAKLQMHLLKYYYIFGILVGIPTTPFFRQIWECRNFSVRQSYTHVASQETSIIKNYLFIFIFLIKNVEIGDQSSIIKNISAWLYNNPLTITTNSNINITFLMKK